ncbi:hypothetical protein [Dactylosporangium matsuzakiense]|uniref:Uncharacterized protein n=1 Tax=Dactylosporangium matsuzakiense TaxID=53360 RepID=A0A9W6KU36_9ACTN|nr:hypothetical protein [Dactylosporangium matsuzakiense]UWZ41674.1 hypothetical protein Dmats_29005 [Dactylosporangium matsuzakiense]GLL06724.1 hypothetical protein GCM10017581_084740 [Dactylosporangium matsuzakiense]
MTSISGISAISGSYSVQFATTQRADRPRGGQDPLEPVARALGLSTSDLKGQLQSGQSLTGLADAKGLSHEDLIAAIKAGKPGDAPAGPNGVSDDDAAGRIAAQPGLPGGPRGPGGAGGDPGGGGSDGSEGPAGLRDGSKVQQLNALLGNGGDAAGDLSKLSATDLVKKFQTQGVDLNQLRSVLESGDLLDVKA